MHIGIRYPSHRRGEIQIFGGRKVSLFRQCWRFTAKSPPPVAEPGLSSMTLAAWRAKSTKGVPKPKAERALVVSGIAGRGDRVPELRGRIDPLPESLPRNSRRRRRFDVGASLGEFRQYYPVPPVHAGELTPNPPRRPSCAAKRGVSVNRPMDRCTAAFRLLGVEVIPNHASLHLALPGAWEEGAIMRKMNIPITSRFPVRFWTFFCVSEEFSNFRLPL